MKVKCIICGAEFEDDVEFCPVCSVGKEYFEPVEEKTIQRLNSDEKYVVIGNGAAGFNAIKAIRERDKTGEILLISQEAQLTYHRPMLTKTLVNLNLSDLLMEKESWYQANQIHVLNRTKIEKIDPNHQCVIDDQGNEYPYTKCILATGSECFIPPFLGSKKPEVIAIKRIEDVQKIHALLPLQEVVVIGGGVLGLEAAWELKQSGANVTVLESAPLLMGRQLDQDAAQLIQKLAEQVGITLKTDVNIHSITGDEHVEGVALESGEIYPCQCVIVSCGVRSNIALAQDAGIICERSIVVNEFMETNIENIYAAGDCAQFEGMNYALWSQALQQGTVAGANAAHEKIKYANFQPALTFNGFNTSLFAIGDTGKNKELTYEITQTLTDTSMNRKYSVNGKLVGAILIGDISEANDLLKQI